MKISKTSPPLSPSPSPLEIMERYRGEVRSYEELWGNEEYLEDQLRLCLCGHFDYSHKEGVGACEQCEYFSSLGGGFGQSIGIGERVKRICEGYRGGGFKVEFKWIDWREIGERWREGVV